MVKKELDKVVWISIFLLVIVLFFAISTSNKFHSKDVVKVNFGEKIVGNSVTITADVSEEEGVSVLTPSGMIVANAIDLITGNAVSDIEKVEFKIDGIIIGDPVTTAPYSIQWDTTKFSNGEHEITAVVTYKSGNKESSSPVKVTVDNGVQVTTTCGNNIKETGEICDGTDLDNKQCTSFSGYTSGSLRCRSDCTGFDFSQCISTTTTTTVSLWSNSFVPDQTSQGSPSNPVELGVKFKSDVDGSIKGIKFYKSSLDIGNHIVSLWDSNGNLLAQATSTSETASGWQQVNFINPVNINANNVYTASYHSLGYWAVNINYFASQYDNPPLHALVNGGVYQYGATPSFPSNVYSASNYWVDVAFTTSTTTSTTTTTTGNTYYVSTTGNDITGIGSIGNPWKTIKYGYAHIASGDTLYIRGGTYDENVDIDPPSGKSESARTIISAYPSEIVIILPTKFTKDSVAGVSGSYITFRNLIFDAGGYPAGTWNVPTGGFALSISSSYVTFEGSTFRNATLSGIQFSKTIQNPHHNLFLNSISYNNGRSTGRGHGIYMFGDNNTVDGGSWYDNAGFGIHIYNSDSTTEDDNIVRNALVYGNGGGPIPGGGIILSSGHRNLAYNNLVYDNDGSGISPCCGGTLSTVANNIIDNNRGSGVDAQGGVSTIKNNIISNNDAAVTLWYGNGGNVIQYNDFSGNGQGNDVVDNTEKVNTISNNIASTPLYVDRAAKNFRIQTGSPTIDVGTTLTEFNKDFDGKSRPQGSAWDIGAYEYGTSTSTIIGNSFYISPSGSDSNKGTSALPWKTFTYAIPKLNSGDTLILKDGTYARATTGFPNIDCSSNSKSGTASQPITLKAENERKAFLQTDGTVHAIKVANCQYWQFEGLRMEGTDNPSAGAEIMIVYKSDYLTIRRNIFRFNNRYFNVHLLTFYQGSESGHLIEENEFYDFHRHAMDGSPVNNAIIRRNYCNSHNRADIPGGYGPSGPSTSGDGCFTLYPGANNVLENNIAENSGASFEMEATGISNNNKFFGNVALNAGVAMTARGTTIDSMPRDTLFKDFVSINHPSYGIYARSSKNTRCDSCTFIGNSVSGGGIGADKNGEPTYSGDGSYSFFGDNILTIGHTGGYGINIVTNKGSWAYGLDYVNSFNNAIAFSPSGSDQYITNEKNIDPQLGTCKVWVPDNSPMKRAGKDLNGDGIREDIGANILYRYENGVLTNKPLWDKTTGQFPCGAIIPGVNDIAGSSCFDVNKRLNVNTNGCSFPAGY
nr:DUF4082 domain-containing protein [Candidatus Woesearchaeota archaeon]